MVVAFARLTSDQYCRDGTDLFPITSPVKQPKLVSSPRANNSGSSGPTRVSSSEEEVFDAAVVEDVDREV